MATKKLVKKDSTKYQKFQELALSKSQDELLNSLTPEAFIKKRVVAGRQEARYIEIGYTINLLNKVFTSLCWNWEIIDKGYISENKEVWVLGRLTIKDHKGIEVSKEQFGGYKIRKHDSTIADAYKSATSDALKKCASLFGISLDVYWQDLETMENIDEEKKSVKSKKSKEIEDNVKIDYYKKTLKYIQDNSGDKTILSKLLEKISESDKFSPKEKEELVLKINGKI